MFSCQNFFRIRQKILNIVFWKVEYYICGRVLFRGRFEKCVNLFSFPSIFLQLFSLELILSGFIFLKGIDSMKFFLKFIHSCVISCNMKCGTCVFREPNDGCVCSCGRIAIIVSVFLDILLSRLVNLVLTVLILIETSNQKAFFLKFFIFCVCSTMEELFIPMCRCVVSNSYAVGHILTVRLRRGMDVYCLILYDAGIFQVTNSR